MFTQWLQAAAGTVTATPAAPAFDANTANYSITSLQWLGTDTWPRFNIDATQTAGDIIYNGIDGSQFWVMIGGSFDRVQEYKLYNAEQFGNVQLGQQLSLGSQDSSPTGMTFGDSGNKLYYCGLTTDLIYEYNCATPYQVAGASYVHSFDPKSVGCVPTDIRSLAFTHNGRKMYVLARGTITLPNGGGYGLSNAILQFSLSTNWNISTARWDGIYSYPRIVNGALKYGGTSLINFRGIQVNADGSRMIAVSERSADVVVELIMDTDHGIGNVRVGSGFSVNSQDSQPQDVYINQARNRVYVIGSTSDRVYQYNLGTAGELSTATYSGKSVAVGTNTVFDETVPTAVHFSLDGTRMYIGGSARNRIFQVSVNTPWELDSAQVGGANGPILSVTTVEKTPRGITFTADGLRFYIVGISTQAGPSSYCVTEWICAEAWNISSATHSGAKLNLQSYDTIPRDLWISGDGSQLIVFGSGNDRGYYFTLTTPFELGTAMHFYTSSAIRRVTNTGFAFSPDGETLVMVNQSSTRLEQYAVLNPYDFSWAIYDSTKNRSMSVVGSPYAICFKPDGTRMYVTGSGSGRIWEFGLGTAWQINTVTYTRTMANGSTLLTTAPYGIDFRDDGSEVFVTLGVPDQVVRLTLTEAWNITTAYKSYSSGSQPVSNELAVSAGLGTMLGMTFSQDGRYLYVCGTQGTGTTGARRVAVWYLSQAWEITSATLDSTLNVDSLNITGVNGQVQAVTVSADGQWLYLSIALSTSRDCVVKARLNISFSLTSVTVNAIESGLGWFTPPYTVDPVDIAVKPDLTRFYIANDQLTDQIIEYTLGTAELIHTGTVTATRNMPFGSTAVTFNQGGTRMFVLSGSRVNRYTLTTAWDLNTATFPAYNNTVSGGLLTQGTGWLAVDSSSGKARFNATGTMMYVLNNTQLREYVLTTPWNTTSAIYNQSGTHGQTTATGFQWSYDGSKLFVCVTGTSSTAGVAEFAATSAYNSASLSAVQRKLLTTPEHNPQGIWIRADGSALWIVGTTRNTIMHYTMTAPFNVNTATLTYELSMLADRGGTSPRDIVWADNGLRFVVLSAAVNQEAYLHEYATTTPFATNLAQWQRTRPQFTLSQYTKTVRGLSYGDQGRRLFVTSSGSEGQVFTYSLAN